MNEEGKQLWAIIESLFAQLQEEKRENAILQNILHIYLPDLNDGQKN